MSYNDNYSLHNINYNLYLIYQNNYKLRIKHMFAINNGKEIILSENISNALSNGKYMNRYKVQLHCVPQYNFLVDAKDCDDAQRIAYVFTKMEYNRLGSKKKITNAATIQAA